MDLCIPVFIYLLGVVISAILCQEILIPFYARRRRWGYYNPKWRWSIGIALLWPIGLIIVGLPSIISPVTAIPIRRL